MATIVTRAAKGTPLTHVEVDANFTNLNADKAEVSSLGTAAAADTTDFVGQTAVTGSAEVPAGTNAQRDGTPAAGYFRFNTDTGQFEGYNGTAWGAVGGGATGSGGDQVFIQNGQTVTTSYTIPADQNAMSTGPVTINAGVTVTVSTGARYVVI